MLEKIQNMMKERGLDVAGVSKGSGIPYTTIDGLFKRGYENARFPTIYKLSNFFGCSMEYLVNDEEEKRNSTSPLEPTEEELELLGLWKKLSREEQLKLLGRMEAKIEEMR